MMIGAETCGMSLSGPIFASCTAARNRSVGAEDPRVGSKGWKSLESCNSHSNKVLQRVLALSIREGTQGGLKPLQPLPEVVDALDRVTRLDQPVDVFVEPDAVVVRVHHMVGLKPVDHLGTERGDRFGDESYGQPVVVGTLPVAVGVELVRRAGRDAGGHHALRHPG